MARGDRKAGGWAWRWWVLAAGVLAASDASAQDMAGAPGIPAMAGTWRTDAGDLFVLARAGTRLAWYEPSTGAFRLMAADSAGAFRAGPGVLRYDPPAFLVRPDYGAGVADPGYIRLLVTSGDGSTVAATRAQPYHTREVAFPGDGVSLAGRLFLPSAPPPHPGVVLVHGSGAQGRDGSLGYHDLVAHRFAAAGFAVLTFDKRGVGGSTGDWRTAGFDALAGDANAAARHLAARDDVRDDAVGLWGISQAGWVAARAVTARPGTAFVALVSAAGAALTAAEQNRYNVETELAAAGAGADDVAAAGEAWSRLYDLVEAGGGQSPGLDSLVVRLRERGLPPGLLPPRPSEVDWGARDAWFLALDVGFDPLPAWERWPGPLLVVLGARDASTPTRWVAERLSALPAAAWGDLSLVVHAGADHFLLASPTGSVQELPELTRFVPDAIEGVVRWAAAAVARTPGSP